MRFRHIALLSFILLFAACGPGNVVNLLSPDEPASPNIHAPVVAMVPFDNNRSTSGIGTRADGSKFATGDSVIQWLNKNLLSDLNQGGMNVVRIQNVTEAAAARADYVLTGTLDEFWLKEHSRTNMSARIKVTYTLTRGNTTVIKEVVSCEQENTAALFSSSAGSKLVDDTMRDFTRKMLEKLSRQVN